MSRTFCVSSTWQFLFSEQGGIIVIDRGMASNAYVHGHFDKLDCLSALLDVACVGLAKTLNLWKNQIADIGAEKVAEALPSLTNLKVAWLGSPSLLYVGGIIVVRMCSKPFTKCKKKHVRKHCPSSWSR